LHSPVSPPYLDTPATGFASLVLLSLPTKNILQSAINCSKHGGSQHGWKSCAS